MYVPGRGSSSSVCSCFPLGFAKNFLYSGWGGGWFGFVAGCVLLVGSALCDGCGDCGCLFSCCVVVSIC